MHHVIVFSTLKQAFNIFDPTTWLAKPAIDWFFHTCSAENWIEISSGIKLICKSSISLKKLLSIQATNLAGKASFQGRG